jgi:hypothetical protein
MSENYDSSWDLKESDEGNLPEDEAAFDKIYEEWTRRDWLKWLGEHLSFPFTLKRMEDDDDAYFSDAAKKERFRLGHTMTALALTEEEDDRLGLRVDVEERGEIGLVPLADCEVSPKTDRNFWPVREYVVWMANQ